MKTRMAKVEKSKQALVFPCIMAEDNEEDIVVILATELSEDGRTLSGMILYIDISSHKTLLKLGQTKNFPAHDFDLYEGEIILSN